MSNGDRDISKEEEDLRQRNTKKVKGGEHEFSNLSTVPITYDDLVEPREEVNPVIRSYKETVLGIEAGSDSSGKHADGDTTGFHGGDGGNYTPGPMNLQIVEKKHGDHECPEIIVPPSAEARLCRPWKQGLLVKLLGRRIGFKALENRLNQLWVQKGTMNLIDLGCEFFLVYLSSPDDIARALNQGPWLIYDHYLTVREWRPNFRPEKEEINRVAAWIRLPELPVEYYHSDFLFFLGDRIGKTVRVDETTQLLSRGKYARLCVEIDLDAPLLAMFELKGHIYKIEYEGLHLLCMACGRFGHHKDQCVYKKVPEQPVGENPVGSHAQGQGNNSGNVQEDGPWMVVQKQRWQKKGKDRGGPVAAGRVLPATLNANYGKTGSRFNALMSNNEETVHISNEETVENYNEVSDMQLHEENVTAPIINTNKEIQKKLVVNQSNGSSSRPHAKNNAKRFDHHSTEVPRAVNTQVTVADTVVPVPPTAPHALNVRQTVPAHPARHARSAENMDQQLVISQPVGPANGKDHGLLMDISKSNITSGPPQFHPTRPPDITGQFSTPTPKNSNLMADVGMMDSEEFMDANDQGEGSASDSDMEVVHETPHF